MHNPIHFVRHTFGLPSSLSTSTCILSANVLYRCRCRPYHIIDRQFRPRCSHWHKVLDLTPSLLAQDFELTPWRVCVVQIDGWLIKQQFVCRYKYSYQLLAIWSERRLAAISYRLLE